MNRRILLILLTLALAFAEPPRGARARERGAAALDQAVRDLATDVRAVCLAAHPDDEDAETLALLRRRYGVETTMVLFTRGEGGQNEIGSSLYRELGALRTRETRAAAEVIGASVRFLGFPDFGFSRSGEEALTKWGREELLRRLVRALRQIRPHLVITNHDVQGGHGQHQAVGITAVDAFAAAADPEAFPEEGPPWEVLKLFVACEVEKATARPETGAVDPVRGLSYAEMGLLSLKEHRSQGTWDWVELVPGPRTRAYRLVRSRVEGGADDLLAGLPPGRPEWLEEARRSGTRAEILKRLIALGKAPEAERPPRERIDRAIAACVGIDLTLELLDSVVTPGESVALRATVRNGGDRKLVRDGFTWSYSRGGGEGLTPETALSPGEIGTVEFRFTLPGDFEPNRPLEHHLQDGDRPETGLRVRVPLELPAPEGHADRFVVEGSVELPVYPKVTLSVSPWGRLLRPVDLARRLTVTVENHAEAPIEGRLRVNIAGTDRIAVEAPDLLTVPPGAKMTVPVRLAPREGLEEGVFGVTVAFGGALIRDRIRVLDVEIPGDIKVGVVTTYGDEDLRAIQAMGIEPRALTDEDLKVGDLDEYDTIVLGIRAYLARPILRRVNRRLLEFVARGGNLVVNYNKVREWSPDFAPFHIEIGRDRVTREDAPIYLPNSEHRLLNVPNAVSVPDFAGWVQERGLYFPSRWDENRGKVVITTADPSRSQIPGLIVGDHGKGTYIYTSLVWYRQLRVLNPGAFKMLANMVSYPWRR